MGFALVLVSTCRAEPPVLTAEAAASSIHVRSGAPVTIVWKLNSLSSRLLEGRLHVQARDGHERLAELVTDELVLNTGEQFLRTVLPPLDSSVSVNASELRLRFAGPRESIELGTHSGLRLPSPWQRAMVIAVCDPWQLKSAPDKQFLVESLRFEARNFESGDRTISTGVSHIPPDAMPADPLGYFGFDIVVLANEGFAELKDNQLQALTRWIDAGGSVCVVPGRQVLRPEHLRFLEALSSGAPSGPLTLDSSGRLDPITGAESPDPAAEPSRILLKRYGLGRAAVVLKRLEAFEPLTESHVRPIFGFLWKLRHDQLAEFDATGKWNARISEVRQAGVAAADPGLSPQAASEMIARIRPGDMQLAPLALRTGDQLLARLMPRNLRVIPLPLVAYMLVLYVLAIGPGDYCLLGAFKRRRFTWVLFPAVTIGFATGTVAISDWYMRVADNRRSVTFLDIGETGTVVRRNRFDLLFRARQGEAVTEVQRGLFSAMNHQQFTQGSWYGYQMAVRQGRENLLDLVAVPEYTGRVPGRYSVRQFLPQWTPQLNRLCSVATGAEPDEIEFDWQSLADLPILSPSRSLIDESRRRIAEATGKAFGREASVCVVSGTQLFQIAGPTGLLQQDDPQFHGIGAPANQPIYYGGPSSERASTFLFDVCTAGSPGGLFNVISQISPTGGRDFFDLPLVDHSDPRQWLLVVMVDHGDELFVYRKLYHGER